MTRKPFDPSIYVHSPADLGAMHVENYKRILKYPGVQWGIPLVDKYVIPMRPGDLVVISGRPGSGKTSLLARQAKLVAQDIAKRGADETECVMYVSWEQHAEEIEAYFQADATYTHTDYSWGRVAIKDVERKARERARLPLWIIGHSRRHIRKQTQPLTLDIVFRAIESMVQNYEQSPKPTLLCFDYAQVIPPGRDEQRYRQVKEIIRSSKDLSLRTGCPILMGAQASRDVDRYDIPIPRLNDNQESSGIEQVPDKVFGIWRPWKTEEHHSQRTLWGTTYEITPDLFFLKMNKQRGDDGDKIFPLKFDMAELAIAEIDLHSQEPVY